MDNGWNIVDDEMQRRLDALRKLSLDRIDRFERKARRDAVAWWLIVAAVLGFMVFLAVCG